MIVIVVATVVASALSVQQRLQLKALQQKVRTTTVTVTTVTAIVTRATKMVQSQNAKLIQLQ